MLNPWIRTGFKAWSLGLEASSVIALRTLKMTTGGSAATKEARRMISEKFKAGLALQVLALTGGLGLIPYSALGQDVGALPTQGAREQAPIVQCSLAAIATINQRTGRALRASALTAFYGCLAYQ